MADKDSRWQIALSFAKLTGAFIFSAGFLLYSLPMLFSNEVDDGTKKWLYGVVGMIVGFWVK